MDVSGKASWQAQIDQAWWLIYLDARKAGDIAQQLLAAAGDELPTDLRGEANFHVAFSRMRSGRFDEASELWLFAYGSLIWKVDFAFLERRPASLPGWSRRFWQGSHDHRGTPQRPGRVVTLVADAAATCTGVAYRITPAVFEHLDHREKNGYLRLALPIRLDDGNPAEALTYVADAGNNRIQVFDGEGNYKSQITGVGSPEAICITGGSPQYLYSSNSNDPERMDNGEIYKLSLDGKIVGRFGRAGRVPREFGMVNAIDCRTDNNLLLGEVWNWRVQRVTLKPTGK